MMIMQNIYLFKPFFVDKRGQIIGSDMGMFTIVIYSSMSYAVFDRCATRNVPNLFFKLKKPQMKHVHSNPSIMKLPLMKNQL